MANAYPRINANSFGGEIIPTAIMIKYIPLDWKTDDVLHLISQRKLPSPISLSFLYDKCNVFRGMAFATYSSPGQSWRVIEGLHNFSVGGRVLTVEFKKKRPEVIAQEETNRGKPLQPDQYPQKHVADTAQPHQQAEASAATRPRREETPPSESYFLLMSYQKDPVEKSKLERFFKQTGDYQEAVNEFCKNRARETQAGLYGRRMDDEPILERRTPTPEEEKQIAEMEKTLAAGGGGSSSESLMVKHQGGEDFAQGTRAAPPPSTVSSSIDEKQMLASGKQKEVQKEGKDDRMLGVEDRR